jgi:plasmid replication initiation protein
MKEQASMRVVQSNFLIEARFKLTLSELKMFLFMIKEIDINDKDFQEYRVFIKDFLDVSKSENYNIYRSVDKITDTFLTHIIKLKQDDDSINKFCLMSHCNYKKGRGYITYRFDTDLKPHLLRLKKEFTAYDIANIVHCKSTYSIRIYQLLKSFEGLKERTITIEGLKDILMIKDEYQRFYDFKVNVIDRAHKELKGKQKNKVKPDLYFEYALNKKGRTVDSITFTIKKRRQRRLFDSMPIDATEKAKSETARLKDPQVVSFSEIKDLKKVNVTCNKGVK